VTETLVKVWVAVWVSDPAAHVTVAKPLATNWPPCVPNDVTVNVAADTVPGTVPVAVVMVHGVPMIGRDAVTPELGRAACALGASNRPHATTANMRASASWSASSFPLTAAGCLKARRG
jgi:hypothetical protein